VVPIRNQHILCEWKCGYWIIKSILYTRH
jgi:hypothetical protein